MRRLGPPIRLLVLDGDHTLWQPLDIICASERRLGDNTGSAGFTFTPARDDPDRVIRDDGVRFALSAGARPTLVAAHAAGIHLAMASYNHRPPIVAMLAAFGLLPLFSQVVAAWTSNKGDMLRAILAAEAAAGRPIGPGEALFVDDDPHGHYRPMAAQVGIRFAQTGNAAEVTSFGDIAALLGLPTPKPAHT